MVSTGQLPHFELSISSRNDFEFYAMNSQPSGTVARKSRVLVVDDHPLVREGLANLINAQHDLMVCGEAEDSAQAIAGMRKPDHVRQNIAASDAGSLDKNLLAELKKHRWDRTPQRWSD